jgi:hypothetical protein
MAKQPAPKKDSASPVAAVVESVANGATTLAHNDSTPTTRINFEFGIDNMVAVGVVHAENILNPKLEQQVSEIHRLSNEVSRRNVELTTLFDKTAVDAKFEQDCQALVEAAARLGIKLTYELVKNNFNPDTLAYQVAVRFHGSLVTIRDYTVDDDRAAEIRDEVVLLREQQAVQSKAATKTRAQLNPGWLDKQLRAGFAENAMHQTESGAETLAAVLAYLDKAISGSAAPAMKQLGKN